ncbi:MULTISPECIES: hypothetical protein [unclassified Thiocapsa]|uniref:hypothetical protein n=1 Tax=unclassified Thiocapsa TaxID=2641286 RepID=UPI0035B3BEBC
MQVEAIYNQGRLEFQTSLKLKHQRFRVRVEIPDQEIADTLTPIPPTYDLADFPPEVREKVAKMAAIAEDARQPPEPQTHVEESEEERQRWAAADLRNASRLEQGRTP